MRKDRLSLASSAWFFSQQIFTEWLLSVEYKNDTVPAPENSGESLGLEQPLIILGILTHNLLIPQDSFTHLPASWLGIAF